MTGLKLTRFGQSEPAFSIARCAICHEWTTTPATDHCHVHGWIRGEVCYSCNYYMSKFDAGENIDDPAWNAKMPHIAYADHALGCPECDPSGPVLVPAPRPSGSICRWPSGCDRPARTEKSMYCHISDRPGVFGFPPHTAAMAMRYKDGWLVDLKEWEEVNKTIPDSGRESNAYRRQRKPRGKQPKLQDARIVSLGISNG